MTSDPIGLNGGPNTYAYSLNNPVRLVDRLGLFSFVAHYFTGNGAPVDLASVGLLDDFQNAETVVWATDGFKTMVKLEAALRARKACDPCDTGTKDSSFSMSDSVVTDVTLEENLFAVGNSQFFRNAECNMSVDCDNKTYSYNCILGYHIRDRFADPIDMGIEIVGGTPYEINAAWVTSCSGSGSFQEYDFVLVRLFTLLFLLGFLSGCGDYSISLPNSYKLVRLNSYEFVIADPGRKIVVTQNIEKYSVDGNWVIGYVDLPEFGSTDGLVTGYFILDTVSSNTEVGLQEKDWKDKLKAVGISEPDLKKPSRFD